MRRRMGRINILNILTVMLLTSCVTLQGKADLVDKRDGKLTLKYFVGRVPNWYESAFRNKAVELCGDKYEVIEKSYRPTTLTVWDDDYYYYWVIACK